ncbi:Transmembrane protein 65 [Aphelenchoides besseyi]|nr:Transmembrane protein 65 [Aphelenchoides besseyi]
MLAYHAIRSARRFRWKQTLLHCPHVSIDTVRSSTSGLINQFGHIRIDDEKTARSLMNHLQPKERELLLTVLSENAESKQRPEGDGKTISYKEAKDLFIFNYNMIMILAGEYIDQSLGALLSISTMAAAALGNIISDVAGVGLAHYVEFFVQRIGIRHPDLTADQVLEFVFLEACTFQLESSRARYTVNSARAAGLVVGCFIGMFPLLFFNTS